MSPWRGFPTRTGIRRAGPVVDLTDRQLATVGNGRLPDTMGLRIGDMLVEYPKGMELRSGHRIALSIIRSSAHERPIYFASRDGEMKAMGLSAWAVSEGLAVRLHMRNLDGAPPPGYRRTGEGLGREWFNYPRSRQLVDAVYSYRGLRGARDLAGTTRPRNIPYGYYRLTALLAALAEVEGDMETSLSYQEMSKEFLHGYLGGSKARRERAPNISVD